MSVDGFIAGPNGEMDWMVLDWDDKIRNYVFELTEPVDTILLGRKMTDGFISYWSDVMTKPDDPSSIDRSHAFAKKMIDTPKIVFTKTLKKSQWPNTDIATGDLTDEISKLKNMKGKDIIVYGGASFDSSLIRAGLTDEFHLFINPVAIGNVPYGLVAVSAGAGLVALGVAYLVMAYGLWRGKRWAWTITMILSLIGIAVGAVSIVSGNVAAIFILIINGIVLYYIISIDHRLRYSSARRILQSQLEIEA